MSPGSAPSLAKDLELLWIMRVLPIPHVALSKMGLHDNAEAFVKIFEHAADMCGWPESEPAISLLLPHSNESQLIAQQNIQEYPDLKQVILRQVDCCQEQHRQMLLAFFWDICRMWLLAKQHSTDVIWRYQPCSAGTVHHYTSSGDDGVGTVPLSGVVGGGGTVGGGPLDDIFRADKPSSLSLSAGHFQDQCSEMKLSQNWCPQIDMTAAVAACLRPNTKKELRHFLGLAGCYCKFVPNCLDITSPMTDITVEHHSWSRGWSYAILCSVQNLHSPDFSLPFFQTDAWDRVLCCGVEVGASHAIHQLQFIGARD